jgi:hypothetical protein
MSEKYESSQFKKLIETLIQKQSGKEFDSNTFSTAFNKLIDTHQAYIEKQSAALKEIDDGLTKNLEGKEILKSLFVFQLHVLRDYLNNIAIEDSNINTILTQMNQKFSNLIDISTKGFIPSGFNSNASNNLMKLQDRIHPHAQLLSQYLSDNGQSSISNLSALNPGVKPNQLGGSTDEYMKVMKKLIDIYSIFNSDVLLKTMSLFSASKLTDPSFEPIIFENMKKLFPLLFINMNDYKALSKVISDNTKYLGELESKITRDTTIYNNISPKFNMPPQPNSRMILIKTLLDFLQLEKADILLHYLRSIESSEDFLKLLIQFITQIGPISDIYKILHEQYAALNNYYEEHVEDKKKVFAYIKERNDNKIKNKRFTIKETNKFLSLKYSADETNDETNKGDTKPPEYYYFGPYTDTFLKDETTEAVAYSTSKLILERLITRGEHVFILGYGQSGAGKTSTLISLKDQLGIIPIILNKMAVEDSGRAAVTSIEMEIIELIDNGKRNYIKYDELVDISEDTYILPFGDATNAKATFKFNNGNWRIDGKPHTIEKYMMYSINNRSTDPTSNNPDSSRSHVIISLKCTQAGDKSSYLLCGDLAGVENKFDCTDLLTLKKMINSYGISRKEKTAVVIDKQSGGKMTTAAVASTKAAVAPTKAGSTSTKAAENQVVVAENQPRVLRYKDFKYDETDPTNVAEYEEAIRTFAIDNNSGGVGEPPELRKLKEMQAIYSKLDDIYRTPQTSRAASLTSQTDATMKALIKSFLDTLIVEPNEKEIILSIERKIPELTTLKTSLTNAKDNKDTLGLIKNYQDRNYIVTFKPFTEKLNELITTQQSAYTKTKGENADKEQRLQNKRELVKYIVNNDCPIRIKEGMFINKSLRDMRDDIKSILISNFNNDTLYFDKSIFPYCINTTIKQSKLERFYTGSSNGSAKIEGDIMNVVKEKVGELGLKKLNIVIFTIIKTDTRNKYNNPPNIPYINTNDLYYHTYINTDPVALNKAIESIKTKARATPFYQKKDNLIVDDIPTQQTLDKLKPIAINLLEKINNNNDATLIGSLISTEKLNNLIFDKMICSYNSDFDHILNQFNPKYFPVIATPAFNPLNNKTNLEELDEYNKSIARKYMKYKSKYMMKRKSRALKK